MRSPHRVATAVPWLSRRSGVGLAVALSSSLAAAQTTDFVSLTSQGTLPITGASGSVASFGVSADGGVIAFSSFATDLVPGMPSNSPGHTYVRDRRAGTTTLVSVSPGGTPGNGQSIPIDVSWSGRWILFTSQATNLDPLDTNTFIDVFLHDRLTSTTTLESVGTGGVLGNGVVGYNGSVSADARFICFEGLASTWSPGDVNGKSDVFVRDRVANTTALVSVALTGGAGNDESFHGRMSPDGRFIVFQSKASNLVLGDTNGKRDVFLRDRTSGTTQLVSVGLGGAPADDDSWQPHVSNDGRFVAFESEAGNLVTGDNGVFTDIFVRDLAAGVTTRVSVGLGGNELNHVSTNPWISADGAWVSFNSMATNHGFPDPTPFDDDVFLFHVPTAVLTMESVNSGSVPANDQCLGAWLSADGRSLVFASGATNLGPFLDTNTYVDVFVRDAHASDVIAYCTAKTNSLGCIASMQGEGAASATAPGPFLVRATSVGNQKPGIFFYGFLPSSTPFQGGTMCVAQPHGRTPSVFSGGDLPPASNCTGALVFDFNARIRSGVDPLLVAGAVVFCQAWYRDPPGLFHSALSNGLRFPILP